MTPDGGRVSASRAPGVRAAPWGPACCHLVYGRNPSCFFCVQLSVSVSVQFAKQVIAVPLPDFQMAATVDLDADADDNRAVVRKIEQRLAIVGS